MGGGALLREPLDGWGSYAFMIPRGFGEAATLAY